MSDTTEVRYLPRWSSRKLLWRSMEYNETFFGPLYRFCCGLVSLGSILLFMHGIIITRNIYFLEFIEQYRGYIQNSIDPVNITVQFIDYRPDITQWTFAVEIVFIAVWTVELSLRMFSAPFCRLYIKSIFFWSVRRRRVFFRRANVELLVVGWT